jgi:hypothetical protein
VEEALATHVLRQVVRFNSFEQICRNVSEDFLQRGDFFAQGRGRDTSVSSTDGSPQGKIDQKMPEGA